MIAWSAHVWDEKFLCSCLLIGSILYLIFYLTVMDWEIFRLHMLDFLSVNITLRVLKPLNRLNARPWRVFKEEENLFSKRVRATRIGESAWADSSFYFERKSIGCRWTVIDIQSMRWVGFILYHSAIFII